MSGSDDLLNDDAEKQKKDLAADVDGSEGEPSTDPAAEDIVTDESVPSGAEVGQSSVEVAEDIAGQGVAAGEVRVVEPPPKQKSSSALFAVLLLLVVLFAGGYYLLNGGLEMSPQALEQQTVEPQRYVIDKNVEVEVVEPQQIAAVEVVKPKISEKADLTAEKSVAIKATEKAAKPFVAVAKPMPTAPKTAAYQVLVGPYLKKSSVNNAAQQLKKLGLGVEATKGRGPVAMTRLLEGIYLRDAGRARIKVLKQKIGDAFLLPAGDKLALYVGSFTDPERAAEYAQQLAVKGVIVTPVTSEVELNGRMLIAMQGDQQAAQKVVAQVKAAGLPAQVKKK